MKIGLLKKVKLTDVSYGNYYTFIKHRTILLCLKKYNIYVRCCFLHCNCVSFFLLIFTLKVQETLKDQKWIFECLAAFVVRRLIVDIHITSAKNIMKKLKFFTLSSGYMVSLFTKSFSGLERSRA